MKAASAYGFVLLTIVLTVYGQLVVKWQVGLASRGGIPGGGKLAFVAELLLNPWIISSFAAAFLAAASWMLAMTKLDLSHAYPFMASTFVLVAAGSWLWFAEPITAPKLAGLSLIVLGIVIGSRG